MPDTIYVNGHEFIRREDGLYFSVDEFTMTNDDEWFCADESAGMVLLLKKKDIGMCPVLLSANDITLNVILEECRKDESSYLWAAIAAPCSNMIGYLQ